MALTPAQHGLLFFLVASKRLAAVEFTIDFIFSSIQVASNTPGNYQARGLKFESPRTVIAAPRCMLRIGRVQSLKT